MSVKVAFIHGRPGPHPFHAALAKSVNADSFFVDSKLRWHDVNVPAWKKYLSWLISAYFFPEKKRYKVFLTEQPHFSPVIMKKLFLNKQQKVVGLLAGEALYFLYTGYYSKATTVATLKLLQNYDALICMGKMAEDLVNSLLGDQAPPIYTVFNGVPERRVSQLFSVQPNLSNKQILFIANGPTSHRAWYKGLDIIIESVISLSVKYKDIQLVIVGDWESSKIKQDIELKGVQNHIKFIGKADSLDKIIKECSLYLHCSRGDAYPTTVLEAMAGGLPVIISEWTGTKEVVQQVDHRLIVPLTIEEISNKIDWYLNLPLEDKVNLSAKGREVVKNYTEDLAIKKFKETFATMEADFGIK